MSIALSSFRTVINYTKKNVAFRFYSKNILRRKPIKVFNVPTEEHLITPVDVPRKVQHNLETKDNGSVGFPSTQKSGVIVPPYEKLQRNDARFTKMLRIIQNRKLREHKGKILLEGKRLINDAIAAGITLEILYFSREKDLADIKFINQSNVELLKVMYRTFKIWSGLTTPPGIMGIFKKPTVEQVHVLSSSVLPVTIICDNIREPGNLGSVIRNAAAAGCANILLTKGCVDPWETKVLRAGSGGHFRIPILNDIEWTHLSNYIPKNATIYIADNSADIDECNSTSDFMSFDELPEDEEEEKKYVAMNESDQPVYIDESYNEPNELEKFEDVKLPCYLYSSLQYPRENIVLYIGGETHGVDSRIVKLACEYGGKKIKIPLENNMESLNSSFALTVILYEIKRQFIEKYVTQ